MIYLGDISLRFYVRGQSFSFVLFNVFPCVLATIGLSAKWLGPVIFALIFPLQATADKTPWRWTDGEGEWESCAQRLPCGYVAMHGSDSGSGQTRNELRSPRGELLCSWPGRAAFCADADRLYFTNYDPAISGGRINAISLKENRFAWSRPIYKGLFKFVFTYQQSLSIDSNRGILSVRKLDNFGGTLELLDSATGCNVGFHSYTEPFNGTEDETLGVDAPPDYGRHWLKKWNIWSSLIGFGIAVWMVGRRTRSWWITKQRRKSGLCAVCGYNLLAHTLGERCPECGTNIT